MMNFEDLETDEAELSKSYQFEDADGNAIDLDDGADIDDLYDDEF